MTDRSVTHSTFTIERVFNAPLERVFAAWGDPVIKNRWFAGQQSTEGDAAAMELDFRVGGTERTAFANTEGGPVFTYEAVFRDIVPNERIVLTNHMHSDETRIAVNLVHIQFDAADAGTRVTITDHGAYLDGHDRADWREAGTRDELDRLENELDTENPDSHTPAAAMAAPRM
ncbi:SRPBCC family protein [Kitasatospora paranensis]|uniref:SRPBCC family protein n=1 Tax=Kitasatospora paranensis TaxID=258053 RepID=A0ABW2FUJ9_9ACTN